MKKKVARHKTGFEAEDVSSGRQGMIIDRYVMLFIGMIACECLIFASLIA